MNSCNTIRSVELLYYYYYWCTYILARYRKCIVILLPKSLVVSFVLLNLFGLYFMFFLFFIRFNFPTTFFKRRLLKFIIFFRCEKFYSIVAVASGRPNCIYRTYDYYAKRAIRLFHGTFSIVFLYTQSFHFLTYHWIHKWLKIFPNNVTYSFQQSEYSIHLGLKYCFIVDKLRNVVSVRIFHKILAWNSYLRIQTKNAKSTNLLWEVINLEVYLFLLL